MTGPWKVPRKGGWLFGCRACENSRSDALTHHHHATMGFKIPDTVNHISIFLILNIVFALPVKSERSIRDTISTVSRHCQHRAGSVKGFDARKVSGTGGSWVARQLYAKQDRRVILCTADVRGGGKGSMARQWNEARRKSGGICCSGRGGRADIQTFDNNPTTSRSLAPTLITSILHSIALLCTALRQVPPASKT